MNAPTNLDPGASIRRDPMRIDPNVDPVRRITFPPDASDEVLFRREWLVCNGLGGYAGGTLGGAPTRRYHGYLIAAQPNPAGR
ncbi:MAG TPA: glycogen debranching enzyme N-terminal domain-containing protein, partial [Kofleriaceae bacterium]